MKEKIYRKVHHSSPLPKSQDYDTFEEVEEEQTVSEDTRKLLLVCLKQLKGVTEPETSLATIYNNFARVISTILTLPKITVEKIDQVIDDICVLEERIERHYQKDHPSATEIDKLRNRQRNFIKELLNHKR